MASARSTGSVPSPIGAALREAKRQARDRAQAQRDALPEPVRASASARIADNIVALPSFGAARAILLTFPFRSEWNSGLVATCAQLAGKTLVSPRVDAVTRMLTLHRVTDLAFDIAPGYRGIPEPRPRCAPIDFTAIDWVLVPGLAFDTEGRRLGYGGGYYDRLLPLLPPSAPRVAGAFEAQVVATVPTGPHDLVVDCIVTEERVLAFERTQ